MKSRWTGCRSCPFLTLSEHHRRHHHRFRLLIKILHNYKQNTLQEQAVKLLLISFKIEIAREVHQQTKKQNTRKWKKLANGVQIPRKDSAESTLKVHRKKKQKMTQFNTTQYIQTTIAAPYVASYDIRPLNEMGLSCSRTLCTRGYYSPFTSHPCRTPKPLQSSLRYLVNSVLALLTVASDWRCSLINDDALRFCVHACSSNRRICARFTMSGTITRLRIARFSQSIVHFTIFIFPKHGGNIVSRCKQSRN